MHVLRKARAWASGSVLYLRSMIVFRRTRASWFRRLSLGDSPSSCVIPRSPPLLLVDGEESRSALKMPVPKAPWSAVAGATAFAQGIRRRQLRCRSPRRAFSSFLGARQPTSTSDCLETLRARFLSRDCGIGMTQAQLSHRPPGERTSTSSRYFAPLPGAGWAELFPSKALNNSTGIGNTIVVFFSVPISAKVWR